MSLAEVLLIDANVRDLVQIALRKATFDGNVHDALDGIPTEPQQLACFFDAGRSLQQTNGERLEQQREASVWGGPGNVDVEHAAVRAVGSRNAGDDHRLELHGVQMPPLPLGGMILQRSGASTLGALTVAFGVVLQVDFDALGIEIELMDWTSQSSLRPSNRA